MSKQIDKQPYKTEIRAEVQTKAGYIHKVFYDSPIDGLTNSVHAAIATAVVTTTSITQPDVPRLLTILGTGSGHNPTGNVVINGTDIRGNVIADTITMNSNTAVAGIKAFATVTSIDTTGLSGMDANNTVTIGLEDGLGLDRCMSENSVLLATLAGVRETTFPTVAYHATDVSQNVVTLNSEPTGTGDIVIWFLTSELTAQSTIGLPA